MPQSVAVELADAFGDVSFAFAAGFNVKEDIHGLPLVLAVADQLVESYERTGIWSSFYNPRAGRPVTLNQLKRLRWHVNTLFK